MNDEIKRETIAYLIVGVITMIIGLAAYFACSWAGGVALIDEQGIEFFRITGLGLNVAISNTVTFVVAVASAFVMNKIFVFHAKSWAFGTLMRELLSFTSGRLVTYFMETGILFLTVEMWGWSNFLMKAVTMTLVTIGNYFISKWAVFRKA